MIKPFLKDEEFLSDVAIAREDPAHLHIWWLGQSGFLIQYEGRHLLFDPYLSDSLTTKYAQTDKPHVRMTQRVVAPERLDFVDLVTSSHNHTDHLDKDMGARMVIPCHYDMFEFNTVMPDDFIHAARELDQPVKVLQNGERWSSRGLA